MLQASCENCVSWTVTGSAGSCTRNLSPPAGEPLCNQYEASASFVSRIMSEMLKEKPLEVRIPIPGETARAVRRGTLPE